MTLSRWLAVSGCLCLLAIPAQAQSTATVCTFSGAATDTNYTEYSTLGGKGFVMMDGPAGAANYYRFTQAGVGNTISEIAFDLTAPGPSSHIVVDFDFRIGGTADNGNPDNHADGMGFVLLNTDVYNQTGTGPSIDDEAQRINAKRDNSFGFALDTWDNGPTPPHGGTPTYDPDNNHVGVTYIGGGNDGPGGTSILLETSLTPFGYNIHRGEPPESAFDDTATQFDHFNLKLDYDSKGATLTVTITPSPQLGIAPFSPINGLVIGGAKPHEVRAAFGAHTGGSTDNHDIANVNITFSP